MYNIEDLISLPVAWRIGRLKNIISDNKLAFVTVKATIGDVTDIITRIWVDGRLMYHASDLIVVNGVLSPSGASLFMLEEDESAIARVGGWEALEYWVDNASEMVAFGGKSFGDVLRGCKVIEHLLNRGIWVRFFKQYDEQFMSAMRGR